MGILNYIFQLVSGKKQTKRPEGTASEDSSFIWCLVGSVIDEHFEEGEEKILRKGTKHFRSGTKVYCFPPKGGILDKVKVLGKHRKTKRTICVVMPSDHIVDWQIQKVSQPYILKMMQLKNGWSNSDDDKKAILDILKRLPNARITK